MAESSISLCLGDGTPSCSFGTPIAGSALRCYRILGGGKNILQRKRRRFWWSHRELLRQTVQWSFGHRARGPHPNSSLCYEQLKCHHSASNFANSKLLIWRLIYKIRQK